MSGMKTRKLGHDGPEVSEIGYGCMRLDFDRTRRVPRQEGLKLIRAAFDQGVTLFDTAALYGPFTNEALVGEALAPVRRQAVIATKFGFAFAGDTVVGRDSRPERIRAAADASLKRLGVTEIDLFYQHRPDPNVPIEDVAGAVGDLIREGKVRHFGLSGIAPDDVRRAHAITPVAALQNEYSPWTRQPEQDGILAVCDELGIGFVPYRPLGRGQLAAGETDGGNEHRELVPLDRGRSNGDHAIVQALRRVARRKAVSPARIALAWLLAQRPWLVPIPGTTDLGRLADNIASAELILSDRDMSDIEAALIGSGGAD